MDAVRVQGLVAGYGGPPVLSGLDVTIARGELVGAVGPSGAGKSTLLRLLIGRARRYAGEMAVFDVPVRSGAPAQRIGFVPQMEASGDLNFPLTVEQAVLLGLTAGSRPLPWFSREEKRQARQMLERLGIGDLRRRALFELSGGQYQRMLLARALVSGAELLLLDEPTSGVDLQTRREILELLAELNADGLTVLLTTHDLNWVAAHLPRVLCLNRTLIADGAPADVFTSETLEATYGAKMRVLRDRDVLLVADPEPLLTGRPVS